MSRRSLSQTLTRHDFAGYVLPGRIQNRRLAFLFVTLQERIDEKVNISRHLCLLLRYGSRFIVACVADETKPRYSPSANQRPKACSAPRVLPVLSIIGSNWLLHMVVLSCTVIGRVDVVEPWLRSR